MTDSHTLNTDTLTATAQPPWYVGWLRYVYVCVCVWGVTEGMVKEGHAVLWLSFLKDAWKTWWCCCCVCRCSAWRRLWTSVSKCVFVKDRERGREEASTRVRARFQVPTAYYNGILISCNFSGYFEFLVIFWLSCSETRTSFIISSSSLKR